VGRMTAYIGGVEVEFAYVYFGCRVMEPEVQNIMDDAFQTESINDRR
jgi:hypothetical protein